MRGFDIGSFGVGKGLRDVQITLHGHLQSQQNAKDFVAASFPFGRGRETLGEHVP